MKLRALAFLISGLGLTLLFQNCSKQGLKIEDLGSIDTAQAEPQSHGDDSAIDTGVPGVDNLVKSCAEAKARGKIQYKTVQINFEDNMAQCPFGQSDNLNLINGTITARLEQVRDVPVPAGATVCQVGMENVNEQSFRYDDNIILTLNNFVLASTTNFSKHLTSTAGLYQYDWSKLVGQGAQNGATDSAPGAQYCAGASNGEASCLFPQTEAVGRVELHFSEKIIQSVLGLTSASNLRLNMITTGDDDPLTDCHHVPIQLNVQIAYF